MDITPIAHVRSDFGSKFGIPRQSGIVPELVSYVVFEEGFRSPEALRGLEGFSHIWLIWQFSQAVRKTWSPTVRPPRLGGLSLDPSSPVGRCYEAYLRCFGARSDPGNDSRQN